MGFQIEKEIGKMSDSEEKKSLNTETEQKAETPAAEAPKAENKETKPSTSSDTAATETSSVKVESEKKTDTKTASKAKLCFPKPNITPKYYKDVEYQNRDKNNLHPDIKVNFSDVIAEPDGAHSFATIWGTSFKTYSLTKYWCYRILTAVLAVPLSVFWGLYFALLAFCSIWCIAPCIKGFIIWTNFVSKIWGLMVRTFLDRLFESIGLVFTKIHVTLRMKNEPEDVNKQS